MHHLHSPLQTKEKGNHCNIKEVIIYHKKKKASNTPLGKNHKLRGLNPIDKNDFQIKITTTTTISYFLQ